MFVIVRNMKIYSGFKVIEAGILFMETSDYIMKFYGCHTDLVHKFVTSVSHMLKGVFTNCHIYLVSSYVIYIWFPVMLGES